MTVDMTRRGNPEFAGHMCQFTKRANGVNCPYPARYEVIVPDSQEAYLACASHLAEAVRIIWVKGTAAVIKQVPGSWYPETTQPVMHRGSRHQ